MARPVTQAVILVGGKGTRLGDLSLSTPKPLQPLAGGRTFLDYLLDILVRQGFVDIILLSGYLGEVVAARYHGQATPYGGRIRVVQETVPRGTAGALLEAQALLDDAFLVLNGDSLLDTNLRAFATLAAACQAPAVMGSRLISDTERYGLLVTQGDRVLRFAEKSASGQGLINTGIYRFTRAITGLIRDQPCSLEQQVFPALASEGELAHIPLGGWFIDIGLPDTLAEAQHTIPRLARRPSLWLDHRRLDLGDPAAARAVLAANNAGWQVHAVASMDKSPSQLRAELNANLAPFGAFIDAVISGPLDDAHALRHHLDRLGCDPQRAYRVEAGHGLSGTGLPDGFAAWLDQHGLQAVEF